VFEAALEAARVNYGFFVHGYVVMPEHVHLLVSGAGDTGDSAEGHPTIADTEAGGPRRTPTCQENLNLGGPFRLPLAGWGLFLVQSR